MQTSVRTASIFTTALLLIVGCSSENKPAEEDIRNALAQELPTYVELNSFSIEATQNEGGDVDPRYISRFKAEAKVTSQLYLSDGWDNNLLFVKAAAGEGDTVELFGKSLSVLFQGAWEHGIDVDGNPIADLGRPLDTFSAEQILVRGSEEEAAHFAALEAEAARFKVDVGDLPINEMITEFYNTKGQWAGVYVIHEVLATLNEAKSEDETVVHAKYSYRKARADAPEGEDRRAFQLKKSDEGWRIVGMGAANSGQIQ